MKDEDEEPSESSHENSVVVVGLLRRCVDAVGFV
jgi:hypothetical protein